MPNALRKTTKQPPDYSRNSLMARKDRLIDSLMRHNVIPETGSPQDRNLALGDMAIFGMNAAPGIGDALAASDVVRFARQGRPGMAALSGIGVLPFVPGLTRMTTYADDAAKGVDDLATAFARRAPGDGARMRNALLSQINEGRQALQHAGRAVEIGNLSPNDFRAIARDVGTNELRLRNFLADQYR